MADVTLHARAVAGTTAVRPRLDRALDPRTAIIFLLLLAGGLLYVAYSLYADVDASGTRTTTFLPYLLLSIALLIAAIIWNLGTWYLGLPASSSHTR